MCPAQGHNAETPVRLKPMAPLSQVKHSTTELPIHEYFFKNSEDPDEMQHNAAFSSGSTLFVKVKKLFRQRNTIFF